MASSIDYGTEDMFLDSLSVIAVSISL